MTLFNPFFIPWLNYFASLDELFEILSYLKKRGNIKSQIFVLSNKFLDGDSVRYPHHFISVNYHFVFVSMKRTFEQTKFMILDGFKDWLAQLKLIIK